METTIVEVKRIDLSPLKNQIKELAVNQRSLKNQRKTVKFVGVRTMEPEHAAYKVFKNKEELRIMYAAYGILRGKDFSQIENGKTLDDVPIWRFKEKVNDLVNKYK